MKSGIDCRQAAWLAVVRAYQLCTRRYEQMLARMELTAPQFDALVAISRLGTRALPKHIASEMLVSRGNITGILNRLQQRQLIALHPHPVDGRARVASLTGRGHRLLSRARNASRRFIRVQMAPFDDREVEQTRHLMERMTEHLDGIDPASIFHDPPAADEHREIEA